MFSSNEPPVGLSSRFIFGVISLKLAREYQKHTTKMFSLPWREGVRGRWSWGGDDEPPAIPNRIVEQPGLALGSPAFVPPSTAQGDPSSSSATGLLQALQRCAPLKSGAPHEEQ